MKKLLTVFAVLMISSALAFAGPSINPFIEIENVGITAVPSLEAGVTVAGLLSPSWFIDLGFTYSDFNLLLPDNNLVLVFEANIGFDELATVNTTGSLLYGCLLSLTCDVTYNTNYPGPLDVALFEPGFIAEGYVGPLSVWGGLSLPWDGGWTADFIPTFGIRVDFDIPL